jgi:glucosyl-3-phosphoglycerate synthase
MGDFFQSGLVTTLHDFETCTLEQIENQLSDIKKRRDIALILPIIPRDLMSSSFKSIINELRHATYISEVVLSLGQTADIKDMVEARRQLQPLPQSHTVVWSSGPRVKVLFDELAANYLNIGPDGKGRGVWTALGYVLSNRKLWVIAVHDCDIRNYSRGMLARLCYPCAIRGMDFEFAKAYYMRVTDKIYGRVTRLFFTPLIRALQCIIGNQEFLNFLHSFRYPLSGEISMSRSLGDVMRIPGDWGLEIGTLAEIYRTASFTRICQVDITHTYEHKHQELVLDNPKEGLLKMSTDIAKVILRTLASQGVVFPAYFFQTLQASYVGMAREAGDQFAADASINNLPYDRHIETQAVESFADAIRVAGTHMLEDPTDIPLIPSWNRVISAFPDFLERLAAIVASENQQADQILAKS